MLKFLQEKRKANSESRVIPVGVLKDALTAYLMPFEGREITDIDIDGINHQLTINIKYQKETKSRTRKD